MSLRNLTDSEKQILGKLLQAHFEGRNEIAKQIAECSAKDTGDNDNYGSVYLVTEQKTPSSSTSRVPVEGTALDQDNVPINVLLHVIDGYVNELEIFKADGTSLLKPINVDELQITVND